MVEQIERFHDFLNYIWYAYQNGRRPDVSMIVEDKAVGTDGVINWALEKSGYTFYDSEETLDEDKPKSL